ncbi:hypothetical protein ACFRQM_15545 [Streptomyces sp. NPDC056831]|uniref:hypothetical protein n=1 Tax=Streptomyces sp. NPDC056831 TaxID=3345954 RepID=UPI0036815D01
MDHQRSVSRRELRRTSKINYSACGRRPAPAITEAVERQTRAMRALSETAMTRPASPGWTARRSAAAAGARTPSAVLMDTDGGHDLEHLDLQTMAEVGESQWRRVALAREMVRRVLDAERVL